MKVIIVIPKLWDGPEHEDLEVDFLQEKEEKRLLEVPT